MNKGGRFLYIKKRPDGPSGEGPYRTGSTTEKPVGYGLAERNERVT